jgi:hypothetical protein
MIEPLSPDDLAWLRQCAAVDGNAYDRVLLHLLERLAALEAAQQQPHQDKLDRLIALNQDAAQPEGEGPSAADLLSANPPKIPTSMAMQYRSAWREGVEDGWNEARAALARWACPATPTTLPVPDHVNLIGFAFGREPWATWLRSGGCLESAHCELSDLMLAVLAKRGRPVAPSAPEVPSAEVKELVAALKEPGDPFPEYRTITSEQADRIAALLQQLSAPAPAVAPVAVSERLPDPRPESEGGDCDAEGRCWWFSPSACGAHKIRRRSCWTLDSETMEGDTHWRPASAIPLPQAGKGEV